MSEFENTPENVVLTLPIRESEREIQKREFLGQLTFPDEPTDGDSVIVSASPEVFSTDDIEKVNQLVEKAKRFVEQIPNLEPTAVDFAKLKIFNQLNKNPELTFEDLAPIVEEINNVSTNEEEFSRDGNFLPTIGLELEIPPKNVKAGIFAYSSLGLSWYVEKPTIYGDLFEAIPHFSYSPWTQSKMLHEFIEMGLLKVVVDEDGKTEISRELPISMHVNFGQPPEISKTTLKLKERMLTVIVESLTLAFSSTKRILSRKVKTSVRYNKEASESKKNKKADGSSVGDVLRLEIKSTEFLDQTTYRLLAESQRIIGAFFEAIKGDDIAHKISLDFYLEVEKTMKDADYYIGMIDYDAKNSAEIMENTDIQQKLRALISRYSRRINSELLNPDEGKN